MQDACRSFSADVYTDLVRVTAKLRRHPLHTKIYDSHGRLHRAEITEEGVLRLLSGIDLAPLTRELTPAAIAAAARGDLAPLARLTYVLEPEVHDELPERPFPQAPAGSPATPAAVGQTAQAPLIDSLISSELYTATYCVETELPWSPASAPPERPGLLHRWLLTGRIGGAPVRARLAAL